MSFTTTINLSSLSCTFGHRLDGVAPSDWSGWSVVSAGDVNGDGFADLISGAIYRGTTLADSLRGPAFDGA